MKRLPGIILAVLGVLALAIATFFAVYNGQRAKLAEQRAAAPQAQADGIVLKWQDQDGHAVVGDESTPRYYQTVWSWIEDNYGVQVADHGTWKQAFLLNRALVVSGAEFGGSHQLGDIPGVSQDKFLLISKRDFSDWNAAASDRIQHIQCLGTVVQYDESMSNFDVSDSTILQFDGEYKLIKGFIEAWGNYWNGIRAQFGGCPTQ